MSNKPALCRTPACTAPPHKISDVLRSLWRTCSAGAGDSEVARSLAINFVGVAAAADEAELRDALDRLQRRTPCRAFLLLVGGEAEVEAEVTATTLTHGATQDIVLEEIAIRLPESGFDAMPGLVRPLLVNDLPNHLFWGASWPRTERHFDDLAQLCEHVVIDSRRLQTPAHQLDLLAERRRNGQRLTDINWLRLRPWRRALAEAFERIPWRAGAQTAGKISYGKKGLAGAMLLAAWLETKLGATIQLDASGASQSLCPERVELRIDGHEVQLEAPGTHILAHVTTPEHCYLPFKVPTSRGCDGDLLAAAIDIG